MKSVGINKKNAVDVWLLAEILSAALLHTPNSRRRSCCTTSCRRWWRTTCPATQPGQVAPSSPNSGLNAEPYGLNNEPHALNNEPKKWVARG